MNDEGLKELCLNKPGNREIFERNKKLIEFHWFEDLTDDLTNEGSEVKYPNVSMSKVYESFVTKKFGSMINQKYWKKFCAAFEVLSNESK
jgi:hypothetical protein